MVRFGAQTVVVPVTQRLMTNNEEIHRFIEIQFFHIVIFTHATCVK